MIETNGSNYNFRFFIGNDLKVDFLFIAGKEQIESAFGRYLGNRPQYYKEMSKDKGKSPLVDYVASIKHPDIDCEEFKTVSFNEFLDLDLDSLSTEKQIRIQILLLLLLRQFLHLTRSKNFKIKLKF